MRLLEYATSLDCSPEGDRRVRQAVPGYYTRIVKAGGAAAVVEDTCTVAYDIYFATHKRASDQLVNAILKATWDNAEKLPPMHPGFKEWTLDRAASADVTLLIIRRRSNFTRKRSMEKGDGSGSAEASRSEPVTVKRFEF